MSFNYAIGFSQCMMESKNSSTNNEFTPRAYQIDLYEKVVQHNTILYLPTGAGKTYIAIMLLKRLSGDIRKYAFSNRDIYFLINTFL